MRASDLRVHTTTDYLRMQRHPRADRGSPPHAPRSRAPRMNRLDFTKAVTALLVAVALPAAAFAAHAPVPDPGVMTVYKSPACGCCAFWVDHMRENGFEIVVEEMDDVAPVKRSHGIPPRLWSCHTATIDGYAIEGHVPAAVVRKLLAERPDAIGIAVPGMPIGSPGMEGPNPQAYDVILLKKDGSTEVFAHVPAPTPRR
jgi:hypothetical protein